VHKAVLLLGVLQVVVVVVVVVVSRDACYNV
jgi:hypothetical protein